MGRLHQYAVVGRKLVEEDEEEAKVYRMKIFAPNEVVAKSRFWYFLRKLRKIKKAAGEVLSVSEIFEKKSGVVKNYGVWVRYKSRSDEVNMYKEYRDVTMTGAVEQLYLEMSGRHRARWSAIQVLKVEVVAAKDVKRPLTLQFIDSKIKFPITHQIQRPAFKQHKTSFKSRKPVTAITDN